MHISTSKLSPTKTELTISADQDLLDRIKTDVLAELAKDVNMAGFRKGHAPANLIEKNVDAATLQSRFMDAALNEMYGIALMKEQLRPVSQPEVTVTKFVPFTELEMKAAVDVVGDIKLGDYKKLTVKKKEVKTTEADVTAVVEDLRARDSQKQTVERAAKDGDEVVIDFVGSDAETNKPISGGTGADYPLVIGSNTFIPGFEPELIGLKAGEDKTFEIAFPADYGAKELQNKKVSFAVTVKEVKEVVKPKLDDAFAAKVGPFKTVAELKADIKKQLQVEKDTQAQRQFESELLQELAEKSKADVPDLLVEEEMDRMDAEEKRNLMYRGQTWQEHLDAEGLTEEQHRDQHRDQAILRVKSGLILGDVAQAEKITVEEAELDARIEELKKDYNDAQMQAELGKPENRREIASRILTEKTLQKIVGYNSK